ncbi:hypothetical protein [Bradyrhizobium sp. HKCCYLS3013]|uniref:hypothetical protein n=1 Tax=Bradyrhizobium sp. HKCCYLS3013 TaxID=3420735 RepID=UPI003EBAD03C
MPQRQRRERNISEVALDLFDELEHRRDRRSEGYRQKEPELMRMLCLTSEYWTVNSVLDRSDEPCHPPGYIAHHDWHRCREVRLALLSALEARRVR